MNKEKEKKKKKKENGISFFDRKENSVYQR